MRVIDLGPDPSLAYRPNLTSETKKEEDYRNFEKGSVAQHVYNTYKLMHTNQNVDFVKQKHLEWSGCNHAEMTMMDAIMSLDKLVDESDPDVDFPNSFHAFQTAEGIRKEHPDKDWFQLVGLIHDVGKVMALWGEPQWAVVGDTFPVGCAFQSSIVFRDSTFMENPDDTNPSYNCKYGIYQKNCGLDNVLMSWGNDEYLYRVLQFNKCPLPKEGLNMIRYHSFYPWHSQGDYMYLCDDNDLQMLPWVKAFNKFDLYTKVEELPDVEKLRVYYQSLVDKYCPGILKW
ncbi:inositol oxygenase [Corythoichthys intestinalis]|uniref:inositol oxygenase n=1 Tax=Corythoichthys intestinalis TaxID=161448 RepID=UPI0025A68745|nr:inositol oxygenase [Corythoichthys intestinalis]XP_061813310.1 inositol oxygenase-like [Nerophis lumbriciformis]